MKNLKRFTIIELLITIGVISILATILMPSLTIAREKARRAKCVSQLRNLGMAFKSYSEEFDEQFPDEDNAGGAKKVLENNFAKSVKLFLCPSANTDKAESIALFTDDHMDYIYRGDQTAKAVDSETGLMADRIVTPNHGAKYGNILFGDGHAEGIKGTDWHSLNDSHKTGGWPADPH